MKQYLGMALVPVLLASIPLVGLAKSPMGGERAINAKNSASTITSPATTTGQAASGQTKTGGANWETAGTNAPQARFGGDTGAMATRDPQIQAWFSKGQWALVDKNYREAVINFESALKGNPVHVRALNGLATAYFYQDDHANALKTIDRAIALDPLNTKLVYTKARVLDAFDKDAEALEAYLTFAAMDPTDTMAISAQRRADDIYQRWETRLTEAQRAYYNGLRFLSLEQPEKAIPLFEKYVGLQPDDVNGHYMLGISYDIGGLPAQAIPHFERVTRSQPTNPLAYYRLGSNYDMMGKKEPAQEAWKSFIKFAPHSQQVGDIHRRVETIR